MEGAEQRKVFIVDDNPTILTAGRSLLKPYYEVYPVQSAQMLFALLLKVTPDLILLDISMPEMDGFETIKRLKANRRFAEVPVIFLTSRSNESSELKGFELGAADYITKPFSQPLLRKRIDNQLLILKQKETIQHHVNNLILLVQEKTQEIFALQNAVLNTVADLVEFRDGSTGGHTVRTQQYMKILLYALIQKGIYTDVTLNWNMDFILPSTQLHDVGMIAIPDAILNKPAKLTPEEFKIMETHVTIGVEAVKRIIKNSPDHAYLRHALNIVGTHHEKWDGSGYPEGLKGEAIPLEGRLMGLIDAYDALVSWRAYKNTYTHEEAVKIITEGKGADFDPALVDAFLSAEGEFAKITVKNKESIVK